jgi:phosphatidate cytidylyltransferase
MRQRITTAVIALLLLFIVLFLAPPAVAQVVIVAVVLGGAWEWSAFLGGSGAATRFVYVAVVGAMLAALSFPAIDAVLVLQVSMVWWLIALIWMFFYPTPIPLAVRWIGGVAVLVPFYAALVLLFQAGPATLLLALLIVWAADSGAFFAGRSLGRVKLAPSISPGKTWEGVIGGLVAVVVLILVRSLWFDTDLKVFVPFCLAIACLSIVGDLTVSMFKRNAGLKDSGALFPGHGGVLDRIDSVAAAAPLFALGVSWAGLQ